MERSDDLGMAVLRSSIHRRRASPRRLVRVGTSIKERADDLSLKKHGERVPDQNAIKYAGKYLKHDSIH